MPERLELATLLPINTIADTINRAPLLLCNVVLA